MATTTGFELVKGASAPRLPDGSRYESRCHTCKKLTRPGLDLKYIQTVHSLNENGLDGRSLGLDSIAMRVNKMLQEDGIDDIRLNKGGLWHHFKKHATAEQRVVYAMNAHQRTTTAVSVPGSVPASIVQAVPSVLDPGIPASQIADRLSALIEEAERILGLVSIRIDGDTSIFMEGGKDQLPIAAALAAHAYASSAMRQHLLALNRISNPRQTVASFLVRVLRMSQRRTIETAKVVFGAMALECSAEPDSERWEEWCTQHGLDLSDRLQTVWADVDRELLALVGGDEE